VFFHQLHNELWKLFGKKRTYIGFAMFLLAQNAVILMFRFTNATRPMQRLLEGNGYLAEQFISTLSIATVMVILVAVTLLPLYVALVGGDLVAKEAEDGTLRMILSRPVSRLRLLVLKWLAGVVFSLVLVLALGAFGLAFTRIWFPGGGMFVFIPGEVFSVFDAWTGLARYGGAHLVMVTKAVTVLTLAFMLSCFNMKPAAATILALSFILISRILEEIPYFADYKEWFLSYHLNTWRWVFAERIPWWQIGQSLFILLGFNLTFLTVGCTVFHVRDIKS
jgi:ABC-2 type transport system permease protein